MVKSLGTLVSHATIALLFLVSATLVPVHSAARTPQSTQNDPGHKEFAEVGGVRFSSPRDFTIQSERTNQLLYIRHDKHDLGVLVVVPDKRIDDELIRSIATLAARYLYAVDGRPYKWKRLGDYEKISSFEVGGGKIQGFNGQQRMMLDYRTLKAGGKELIVGYFFGLGRGADAEALFERNLGGDSMPGSYAQAHVIASITGEKYDKLNLPDSFIAVPLKKQ
ncbi:MAG: hypothetical protein WAU45_20305 [Blastocatellia bacterium]